MTTDPRVIAAAKALSDVQRTLVTGFCPEGNYAEISGRKYWFGADHEARDKFVAEFLSRVVLLKWLEQEPSRPMIDAVPWEEDIPTNYRAMCAQAAKEIAE